MQNILIVDDSEFSRQQIRKILEKAGKKVVGEGQNGNEAVSLYKELKPDLLILDITMPELSGLDALILLKEEHPDIKVVMCSTLGSDHAIAECIEEGALGYVVKPFRPDMILEQINRIFPQ